MTTSGPCLLFADGGAPRFQDSPLVGVISGSQFSGQRYFSDFSLRCVSSSSLSHLKFTILPSLSHPFIICTGLTGDNFRPFVWSQEFVCIWYLWVKVIPDWWADWWADSAVGYVSASLFYFNDLSDSPIKAMFLIKDCRRARRGSLVLEVPPESTSVSSGAPLQSSKKFLQCSFLKDNSITQLTVLRSTLKTECSGSRAVSHVTH